MCVLHDALSQERFPTNQWDSNARTETSDLDIVNTVLRLDQEMFQLVLGDEGFDRRIKTAEDGGKGCGADPSPERMLAGEALCVFKLL